MSKHAKSLKSFSLVRLWWFKAVCAEITTECKCGANEGDS